MQTASALIGNRQSQRSRWQRFKLAFSYHRPNLTRILRWLNESREFTNFTYALTPLNEAYLAAFVAQVTRRPLDEIEGYLRELSSDAALREHVIAMARERGDELGMDESARFGRRAGWYAICRALKPRVVIETGVDKGLGTCVLAAALKRNAEEGSPGRVYGTDINPAAGVLLSGEYKRWGELLIGDSLVSLRAFSEPIDLFINDSDHSADYEAQEYKAIESKLRPGAVVLGDNAHVTAELLKFARRTQRQFLFFAKKPADHWYPGGGIGAAFGK